MLIDGTGFIGRVRVRLFSFGVPLVVPNRDNQPQSQGLLFHCIALTTGRVPALFCRDLFHPWPVVTICRVVQAPATVGAPVSYKKNLPEPPAEEDDFFGSFGVK